MLQVITLISGWFLLCLVGVHSTNCKPPPLLLIVTGDPLFSLPPPLPLRPMDEGVGFCSFRCLEAVEVKVMRPRMWRKVLHQGPGQDHGNMRGRENAGCLGVDTLSPARVPLPGPSEVGIRGLVSTPRRAGSERKSGKFPREPFSS